MRVIDFFHLVPSKGDWKEASKVGWPRAMGLHRERQ